MRVEDLDYELPPDLIAQRPIEPRDHSRLMVVDRRTGVISHRHFWRLPEYFDQSDLLIANNSKVIHARLRGVKPTGGAAEVLLLEQLDDRRWKALVGGRNVSIAHFTVPGGPRLVGTVAPSLPGHDSGTWVVTFDRPVEPLLPVIGAMPLPPYIHETLRDDSRYQTVYAAPLGSAAAPTAGLHFTPRLIMELAAAGVRLDYVTLHVGLDTFKPISESTVEAHAIHGEWCSVSAQAAAAANGCQGRVVAVGTTSARTLETAGRAAASQGLRERVCAHEGVTDIYITPGHSWRAVDALITNFHLPRSTLLAMVGSFMGMDLMWRAYREAVSERYRFYSFGDAMLIL